MQIKAKERQGKRTFPDSFTAPKAIEIVSGLTSDVVYSSDGIFAFVSASDDVKGYMSIRPSVIGSAKRDTHYSKMDVYALRDCLAILNDVGQNTSKTYLSKKDFMYGYFFDRYEGQEDDEREFSKQMRRLLDIDGYFDRASVSLSACHKGARVAYIEASEKSGELVD